MKISEALKSLSDHYAFLAAEVEREETPITSTSTIENPVSEAPTVETPTVETPAVEAPTVVKQVGYVWPPMQHKKV